ncbi:MAG: uroporphyrinogen decarboxylase [Chloroflexota bacterium]|nr:MAG: uroporphyrinogen decarboxylase [Chloroflexota bacterium]
MNSFERFHNRLHGLPVDRPPNFDIMMTFAAHFIGQPLSRYYLDYRVLAEANQAVQQAFDLDLLQAISDPYREASDMGLEVEFPEDGLPVSKKPLVVAPEDLSKVRVPNPSTSRRMSDRLEAIRAMKSHSAGQVPVMGWVEGALAEAADLRGVNNTFVDLYERPQWLLDLLEHCVEVEIAFARLQVEAGADIIGLGDAVCSQISPRMYRRFALPYERRIFDAVHQAGSVARLHICGNTTRLLPDMAQCGADIVDLDWMVGFGQAAEIFGTGPAPCGNFDPVAVMFQGTPDMVYESVRHCLRVGGARSFVMAGCEIPDGTPHENLRAQAQALVEYGGAYGT